jgi:polyhydroxyalkanoate synthesis repressor PhaR
VDVTMSRLIKRYGNRKMYDTEASRYVTLEGVTELVRSGEDLRIIDNESGEDLTSVTFAQIIYEEEKRKNGMLEVPALRWIIQQGGATLQEILSRVDKGREAIENVREIAGERMRHVRDLMQGGESRQADGGAKADDKAAPGHADKGSSPQGLRVLSDLLEGPQKQLEQLQHRIDSQVRASIERLTQHPTLRKELRRIEDNVKGLERQLARLRGEQEKPVRKSKRQKKH